MCQAQQKQVRKGRSMDIVYEDKRIVVAIKPAGVVSVDQPGGMPELLRQTLHTACIRTVHRLDAPVAGLMVFARSAYAAGELSRQIREGEFEKTYLAVVRGMPRGGRGRADGPAGRGQDAADDLCGRGAGKGRAGGAAAVPGAGPTGGMRAGAGPTADGANTPDTGAIRVTGDAASGRRRYGDEGEADTPIALWSAGLAFRHPETGEAMAFELAPPQETPWSWFQA